MVISRVSRKHNRFPYFPFYTFIFFVSPYKFLSSIHSFFKKSIAADCCSNDMLNRFKIMVTDSIFSLFLHFIGLLFRKQVRAN